MMQYPTKAKGDVLGWTGELIEMKVSNHNFIHKDEPADSIEVSLAASDSYGGDHSECCVSVATTDDGTVDANQLNRFSDSILSPGGVIDELQSSPSSLPSSSSSSTNGQKPYLQLAVPNLNQFIEKARSFAEDSLQGHDQPEEYQSQTHMQTNHEESRDVKTVENMDEKSRHCLETDFRKLRQQQFQEQQKYLETLHPTFRPQQKHEQRDFMYRFQDSQGEIYYPKQRSSSWGPRQSRMSLHSRIEFWHHQLSKPIRALKVGNGSRSSIFRPPRPIFRDCLGRNILHAIANQPTNETGELDDDSSHSLSSDGFNKRRKMNGKDPTQILKGFSYGMRSASTEDNESLGRASLDYSVSFSRNETQTIIAAHTMENSFEKLVVIDFDEMSLPTRPEPMEEKSSDDESSDDESERFLNLHWDLA